METHTNIELLNSAFEMFNKTSNKLSDSYHALQNRIKELNLELDHKNKEIKESVVKMKRLEEQAARRDKLIAMGEMAAKIAHEIRNPLGGIELFASLLKKELQGNARHLDLVDHILTGVRNSDNVISNLLMFTKTSKVKCQNFDLHVFLGEILDFIANIITQQRIEVVRKFDDREIQGYGDSELLKQVLLNVLLNAIQAMPEGGRLTVSTGDNVHVRNNRNRNKTDTVLTISDTGTGMDEKDQKRIFDPFYTTRDSGTGLGLTIVHNIVEAHKGSVEVESKRGKGSVFFITLPFKSSNNL